MNDNDNDNLPFYITRRVSRGGGPRGPGPPPLEIEKQKKKKKKKKKGFQILGPPSYEFLDTRLITIDYNHK